jgi:hypothetical protein
MGFLDVLNHLVNFVAPAAVVALLVVVAARFLKLKSRLAQSIIAQAAINFIACVAVLSAGLWFFGRDGKVATYTVMVLVAATVQWLLLGAWRK